MAQLSSPARWDSSPATISPRFTRAWNASESWAGRSCGKARRRSRSPNNRAELTDAETVMARCDQLAACSDEPDRLTRPFASGAMRQAHELVVGWMQEAGLEVRRDNIGNLRGRIGPAEGPTLLMGSHLDSVRGAGKY